MHYEPQTKKRSKAFTLIEVLLITALLGISIAASTMLARARHETLNVQKIALLSQEYLKAAVNYYGSHDEWPIYDANDSVLVKEKYLDANTLQNPWGILFKWGSADKARFRLQIEIPVEAIADETKAKKLLERIASLLPSAEFDPSNNRILYTYVGLPTGFEETSWRVVGIEPITISQSTPTTENILSKPFVCAGGENKEKAFCAMTLNAHLRAHENINSTTSYFYVPVSFGGNISNINSLSKSKTTSNSKSDQYQCVINPAIVKSEQKALSFKVDPTSLKWNVRADSGKPVAEEFKMADENPGYETQFTLLYGCCPYNSGEELCSP